jgi:hypothetical protein
VKDDTEVSTTEKTSKYITFNNINPFETGISYAIIAFWDTIAWKIDKHFEHQK